MIGDGWDDVPSVRPTDSAIEHHAVPSGVRRCAVVTGTRAEFGLLRSVMRAIDGDASLQLACVASGAHLVGMSPTYYEVKREFNIAEVVPMQATGAVGRAEDVQALGRGVARFGRAFERLRPDWVVVLGDRIEAFAAASAAAVGGLALAHIHGGDRAEGIADESMRHAITKLAHLHLPATQASRERIVRMGEDPSRVHVVGSPALDDLHAMPALDDEAFAALGSPTALLLLHPVGQPDEVEEAQAALVLDDLRAGGSGERVLALEPNLDAGRTGIVRALRASGVRVETHLPRGTFVGLLKRLASAASRGVLVGNSSAGLIEAAALRVPVVDIGPRQDGRERVETVVHVDRPHAGAVAQAVRSAREREPSPTHPFGDGHAGANIARLLATVPPRDGKLLRKRNAY